MTETVTPQSSLGGLSIKGLACLIENRYSVQTDIVIIMRRCLYPSDRDDCKLSERHRAHLVSWGVKYVRH